MSLQDERHPHVRNACLVELIALAREPQLLVEGHGLHLRVQVRIADAVAAGLFEQPEQDLRADAPTAQPGEYRDATDLTGGLEAPGANWVTVQAREDVNASRILVIPLVFFAYLLLFDENGAANPLEQGAVGGPVREHTFYLRLRHGRGLRLRARAPRRDPCTKRVSASRAARVRMSAGRASRRNRAAPPRRRPARA